MFAFFSSPAFRSLIEPSFLIFDQWFERVFLQFYFRLHFGTIYLVWSLYFRLVFFTSFRRLFFYHFIFISYLSSYLFFVGFLYTSRFSDSIELKKNLVPLLVLFFSSFWFFRVVFFPPANRNPVLQAPNKNRLTQSQMQSSWCMGREKRYSLRGNPSEKNPLEKTHSPIRNLFVK